MENIENKWKNILDNEYADSRFEPDMENIWEKVSAGQRKKKKAAPWITHLAAALAGILITLSLLWPGKRPQQQIADGTGTSKDPVVIHDTVQQTVVMQNNQQQAGTNKVLSQKRAHVQKPAGSTNHIPEPEQQPTEDVIVQEEPPLTHNIITQENNDIVTSVQAPAPIHLADIQTDKNTMMKPNAIEKIITAKLSAISYTSVPSLIDIFKSPSK